MWGWDPTLYAGAAAFYPSGRVAYPQALADELATALELNGSGRLLDIGCGPGSLTLLLAPLFAEVIGIDPDADMLAEAARRADRASAGNVSWRRLCAEELPADLPRPTVITLAQSFHWMDRSRVAAAARTMLDENGAVVIVHATTHQGVDTDEELPHPRAPRAAIAALIQQYLGPGRRAGRRVFSWDATPVDPRHEHVCRSTGFRGPQRIEIPARIVERTADEVRASVYSLSSSTPHLFGSHLQAFDTELRTLLQQAAPDGVFSERFREITVDIWR